MCDITQMLLRARLARPYYARGIAALTPVAMPEGWPGRIAVDRYWRLYYDPVWLSAQTPEHQAHVIAAHELEHLLRHHAKRQGPRTMMMWDPRTGQTVSVWNLCADAEINDDIDMALLPPDGVTPKALGHPDGWLAEEYYAQFDETQAKPGMCCGGGSGAGTPRPDELDAPAHAITEPEAETLRDLIAADVRRHVAAHGRGSVPAHVQMWAEARAAKVTLPWWSRLMAVCRGCVTAGRSDYSWRKPARRATEVIRPGMVTYRPQIGVVVDTSGSMTEFGTVVLGVTKTLTAIGDVVAWIECDAEARRKTRPHRWTGGGGTDMRVGLAKLPTHLDMAVVVTDGLTPWPTTRPAPTALAIIVGDATVTAPSGWTMFRVKGDV